MTTNTLLNNNKFSYDFDVIVDEVRALLDNGTVTPLQPLYILANYIPSREWLAVEMELENKGYLLRNRIGEILAKQQWDND
jgi:hypothetical protein